MTPSEIIPGLVVQGFIPPLQLGHFRLIAFDMDSTLINITFRPNPPVEPMRIIELVQKNKHIKLAGNDKLRIEKALTDPKDRAQYVRDLLRQLGQPVKNSPGFSIQ